MLRLRTIGSALALVLLLSSAAFGQGRFEITPMVGISTAGSVDINDIGQEFSVGSGFTWGGTLGYYLSRYVQFEIEYARQNSSLAPEFTVDPELPESIGLGVDQILGNFVFQTTVAGGGVAPFFLVGAGAAIFTPDNSELAPEDALDSSTRFQWGIGGGVKLYVSDRIGFRFQGRYRPTNVGSQPEFWCGIWTCGIVEVTQYLNSGEFLGGVIIRI
ncbi:MAG: outer membrane beta-barrel protein [Gemmatimonadota bacterium]|nr:outer membrane beta-barrel protein [Gemmatimonadota bacterium]